MLGSQLVPEKEMGLSRNTDPDGTTIVDATTLQASAQAASNACNVFWCLLLPLEYIIRIMITTLNQTGHGHHFVVVGSIEYIITDLTLSRNMTPQEQGT